MSDWRDALQTQLSSLIRQAWIDYQSNPSLRKEWAFDQYADEPDENEREERAAISGLTQDDFTGELLLEIEWLLNALGYLNYEPVLEGVAPAFASVARGCPKAADARRNLEITNKEINLNLGDGGVWRHLGDLVEASISPEWYIRSLLSILIICSVVVDEEGRQELKHFFGFLERRLRPYGASEEDNVPCSVSALVCEICDHVGSLDFAGRDPSFVLAELVESCRRPSGMHWTRATSLRTPNNNSDIAAALTRRRFDPSHWSLSRTAPAELYTEYADVMSELAGMVGLDAVKQEVISLANFIKVRGWREERGLKLTSISLHLVFTGNPGTGKTTVARLVAKLFKALGVLSQGHLVEVDRGGLVSQYVGGTAIKTKEAVESALDGVLFVDEAYSLYKETTWGDVGTEAIEALLKLMEDNRHRLVVIAAGYPDKMDEFIRSNPGLKSRFTRQIHFEDYTAEDMLQIFEQYTSNSDFKLDTKARQALLTHFRRKQGNGGYGNGRGVRNDFEEALVRQANRIAPMRSPSDRDLTVLLTEDVIGARPIE